MLETSALPEIMVIGPKCKHKSFISHKGLRHSCLALLSPPEMTLSRKGYGILKHSRLLLVIHLAQGVLILFSKVKDQDGMLCITQFVH